MATVAASASDDEHTGTRHGHVALSAVAGRCASVGMLMREGLLTAGAGVLSVDAGGRTFAADLLSDGQIRAHETADVFASLGAWTAHCRRVCGGSGGALAAVKYRGNSLQHYRDALFQRRQAAASDEDCNSAAVKDNYVEDGAVTPSDPHRHLAGGKRKHDMIEKMIVKYEMLGPRSLEHDACTLVECVPFTELHKLQPFLVSITSTALAVLRVHCHVTKCEVLGYLAGKWDVNSHQLAITHAFPCRCRTSGPAAAAGSCDERAAARRVEFDIFSAIHERKLTLVGWYHSHPNSACTPTIRDIDQQLDCELRLKASTDTSYTPCVGMIYSPHTAASRQQQPGPLADSLLCYWVMPPSELRPLDYPRPLAMEYTVNKDACIHTDAFNQMSLCVEYYRGMPGSVDFGRVLPDGSTPWQHLTEVLESCAPAISPAGRLVDFLRPLLLPNAVEHDAERQTDAPAADNAASVKPQVPDNDSADEISTHNHVSVKKVEEDVGVFAEAPTESESSAQIAPSSTDSCGVEVPVPLPVPVENDASVETSACDAAVSVNLPENGDAESADVTDGCRADTSEAADSHEPNSPAKASSCTDESGDRDDGTATEVTQQESASVARDTEDSDEDENQMVIDE